jgi:hypothetical protein
MGNHPGPLAGLQLVYGASAGVWQDMSCTSCYPAVPHVGFMHPALCALELSPGGLMVPRGCVREGLLTRPPPIWLQRSPLGQLCVTEPR